MSKLIKSINVYQGLETKAKVAEQAFIQTMFSTLSKNVPIKKKFIFAGNAPFQDFKIQEQIASKEVADKTHQSNS